MFSLSLRGTKRTRSHPFEYPGNFRKRNDSSFLFQMTNQIQACGGGGKSDLTEEVS